MKDLIPTYKALEKSYLPLFLGLPIPVRAITFTQTQLAQVLQKLGQVDEAMAALMQAGNSFHTLRYSTVVIIVIVAVIVKSV